MTASFIPTTRKVDTYKKNRIATTIRTGESPYR